MKIALQLKAILLLLLLAVSLLPMRIFCQADDNHQHASLSIHVQSDHHDCPFCTFEFCHDFERQSAFSVSPQTSVYLGYCYFSADKAIHVSVSSKNKGPPSLFI